MTCDISFRVIHEPVGARLNESFISPDLYQFLFAYPTSIRMSLTMTVPGGVEVIPASTVKFVVDPAVINGSDVGPSAKNGVITNSVPH